MGRVLPEDIEKGRKREMAGHAREEECRGKWGVEKNGRNKEVHESMQKMNPVGKENTRKKNM